jgi:hypothetical protein
MTYTASGSASLHISRLAVRSLEARGTLLPMVANALQVIYIFVFFFNGEALSDGISRMQ